MDSMDGIGVQLVNILVADVEGISRGLREFGHEYECAVEYLMIPKEILADLVGPGASCWL